MNCKHCGEPIQRCDGRDCGDWRHTQSGSHFCAPRTSSVTAEPETGTPGGEVQ